MAKRSHRQRARHSLLGRARRLADCLPGDLHASLGSVGRARCRGPTRTRGCSPPRDQSVARRDPGRWRAGARHAAHPRLDPHGRLGCGRGPPPPHPAPPRQPDDRSRGDPGPRRASHPGLARSSELRAGRPGQGRRRHPRGAGGQLPAGRQRPGRAGSDPQAGGRWNDDAPDGRLGLRVHFLGDLGRHHRARRRQRHGTACHHRLGPHLEPAGPGQRLRAAVCPSRGRRSAAQVRDGLFARILERTNGRSGLDRNFEPCSNRQRRLLTLPGQHLRSLRLEGKPGPVPGRPVRRQRAGWPAAPSQRAQFHSQRQRLGPQRRQWLRDQPGVDWRPAEG